MDDNSLNELVLEALKIWDVSFQLRGIEINTGEFRQRGMIEVKKPFENDRGVKPLYEQPYSHIRFLQTRYDSGEWVDSGLKIVTLIPSSTETQKIVTDDGMNWKRKKSFTHERDSELDRYQAPIVFPLIGSNQELGVGELELILGKECRTFKNSDEPFRFADMQAELEEANERISYDSLKVRNPLDVPQTFAYLRVPGDTKYNLN